ncbi:hypothetical protein GPALN_006221 [Globodera pallida]|nr:hypothetical protein GPALN_006221 [Globodera pallida]
MSIPTESTSGEDITADQDVLTRLGHGFELSESDRDKGLLYASQAGKADLVRLLLSKGARVDWTTDQGFSPLFLAAREGHLEVCKLLIAKGADTNQKTNNGVSPWLIACGKGRLDIGGHFECFQWNGSLRSQAQSEHRFAKAANNRAVDAIFRILVGRHGNLLFIDPQ